jgi:hypothetical protein
MLDYDDAIFVTSASSPIALGRFCHRSQQQLGIPKEKRGTGHIHTAKCLHSVAASLLHDPGGLPGGPAIE